MTGSVPWYVITGAPSSGKTSVIQVLQKLGYAIVEEAARAVIDEALRQGQDVQRLRQDERVFQETVARRRLELEAVPAKDTVVFIDRGMPDTLAYLRYYHYPVAPWIRQELENMSYRQVFLMEPLSSYRQDYARVESQEFVSTITDLLHEAYTECGLKPVVVPALSIEERIQFILQHLQSTD